MFKPLKKHHFRMINLNKTLLFFSVIFCFQTANADGTKSSFSVLSFVLDKRSDAEKQRATEASPTDELEFTFEPDNQKDQKPVLEKSYTLDELRDLTHEMNSQSYEKSLSEGLVVPVSSTKSEDVDALLTKITEAELNVFLNEKARLLNHLVKLSLVMSKVKKKVSFKSKADYTKINKLIHMVNDNLFEKADLLARGKSVVVNISAMTATGFGIPSFLQRLLAKKTKSKFLNKKLGFYFYFSLGFSVVANKDEGKMKLRFIPTFDFKKAKEIFSPFFVMAGGLVTTVNIQETKTKFVQRTHFLSTPVSTLVSHGDMTGFTIPTAAANLVPGGAWAMALSGEMKRVNFDYRLVTSLLTKFKKMSKTALDANTFHDINTCRVIFN
jgi:hypothetical protein